MAVLTEHFFELSDGGYQVNAFTREKTNELVIFRVQIGHHFYVEVQALHAICEFKVNSFAEIVKFRGTLFIEEFFRLAFYFILHADVDLFDRLDELGCELAEHSCGKALKSDE